VTDIELAITALGRRGEGIARHDGASVLVPGTLPGETVMASVDGERGSLRRIVTPSPERVRAFCRHYETCGGCQLQHWREEPYRRWKAQLVETALRSRGIEAKVRVLIDAHGAGRRRVGIHARRRDGVVTAGFMAARSHALLDLDRCPVLVVALAPAFDIARAIGEKVGDCDVALTATDGGIDASVRAGRKIVEQEMAKFAALAASLRLARLSVNGSAVVTERPPLIRMGRADVAIPPVSFLQATAEGEAALARLVTEAIGKSRAVADLFSGCGPFTFRLAETAKVWAYDSDRPAIAALAAATRVTPGLKPVTAAARDLFREPLVATELKAFDAVVFDPPRAGAESQARQLAKSKVKTVAAVSCDPASFARDAEILASGGYTLEALTAVDQFKWTSHVEIVAVFRRA
jgi:23S rRNA (uracil1939-C5)-methyltransferase